MTVYTVKTKTSEYVIDRDNFWWWRNGYPGRIFDFKTALEPEVLPWNDPDGEVWKDARIPEVGKRMYLTSREQWVISTEVVSVEIK